MESQLPELQNALLGFAIALAIPIAAFLLWSDYFERYILQLTIKRPLYEREPELEKVRLAGFFAILFQFIFYLSSSEVRKYGQAQLIFTLALLLQIFCQARTEKKIRPPEKPEVDFVSIAIRALFCWVIGLASYALILILCVQVSMWFSPIIFSKISWAGHSPKIFTAMALVSGGTIGIIFGLMFNFSMGPFYIRKILPHSENIDPVLISQIKAIFVRHKEKIPKLVAVELDGVPLFNILVTGFNFLFFKQFLFLSRNVLNSLSFQEIEVILLNQLSHIQLRHIRNRFLLGFFLLILTMAFGVASIFLAERYFFEQKYLAIIGPIVAIFAFVLSFRCLAHQVKQQEKAADLHCMKQLGVKKDDLIQAMIHLDAILLRHSQVPLYISPEVVRRIEWIESVAIPVEESEEKKAA